MYCIYCLTSPSGLKYIGLTKRFKKRMEEYARMEKKPLGKTGQRAIRAAMRKYGFDAFTVTVLDKGLTREEAMAAEVSYIASEGTLAPSGYNCTEGGEDGKLSPETCAIIRAKGIKRFSDPAERAKVSERRKAWRAKNPVTPEEAASLKWNAQGAWNNPEVRGRLVESAKRRWADKGLCKAASARQAGWYARVNQIPEARACLLECYVKGTPSARRAELRAKIKSLLDSATKTTHQ